jgi:hypothetical protein
MPRVSVGLTAVDDPSIFIPLFDELSPTSAQRDSFEVLINCPVATLLLNIVARFLHYRRGLFMNSSSTLFHVSYKLTT